MRKGDFCAFFFFFKTTYLGQFKCLTTKLLRERTLTLFIIFLTVTLDEKEFQMARRIPAACRGINYRKQQFTLFIRKLFTLLSPVRHSSCLAPFFHYSEKNKAKCQANRKDIIMAASHYQKNHIFKMLKNALNII